MNGTHNPIAEVKALTIVDRPASRVDQVVASAIAVSLLVATLISLRFSNHESPFPASLFPIIVALWVAADFLTAYFAFREFAVSGRRGFLFLGFAYAMTGFGAIPFLAKFPGIFLPVTSVGDQQFSTSLEVIWHCLFPAIIGAALLIDPAFKARISAAFRPTALWFVTVGSFAFAFAVSAILLRYRDALPVFVLGGEYQLLWARINIWLTTFAIAVLVSILMRTRARNAIQCWLILAILTASIESATSAFLPGRFSLSWYVGKLEILFSASFLLIAILRELASVYERLSQMAMLDALTGLRNRRGLSEVMQYTLDIARRHHAPTALCMIDIDHFKLYNDSYGHAVGDIALHNVAQTLQGALTRSTDVIARFGGEEFVVLLPATDNLAAWRVAQRLRAAVETLRIPHADESTGTLSVSIGVAGTPGEHQLCAQELFDDADAALYEAKAAGRNCVAICPRYKVLPVAA